MPKLLLIQSTQYSFGSMKPCKQKRIYLPGLAFPLMGSFVPENWDLEINLEVVEDINFETDADLVGIGAMGHAIFIQGADNTLVEDCHVDGLLRTTDHILAEKSGFGSLASFSRCFKAVEGITPGKFREKYNS